MEERNQIFLDNLKRRWLDPSNLWENLARVMLSLCLLLCDKSASVGEVDTPVQ